METIVFIVLNLMFIGIFILFISLKSNDAHSLEEHYAKKIALILDSAKPEMVISLDMTDAFSIAEKNFGKNNLGSILGKIVTITGNIVNVKLSEKGGYSYSFFNDVNVTYYPDTNTNTGYIFLIKEKKEENAK